MADMTVEQALELMQTVQAAWESICGMAGCVSCKRDREAITTLRAELDGLRAERRKWAAEEMRGLVAGESGHMQPLVRQGHNTCRAETLANITKWEKANEGQ